MLDQGTIVALATADGVGGVAIVRLSGPDAVAVARRVFRARAFGPRPESHRAVYGRLHWPRESALPCPEDQREIDRCLALPLLGGRSYTGEDTVELHCHGGRAVARRALAACRAAGARPAAPGEFTRRAFLNGRLSLDQAEAVADLVGARGDRAAAAALRQLAGGLDRELRAVEEPLLALAARLEGSFEFLDEEELDAPPADVAAVLAAAVARIDELVAMAPAGRMLRDGVQVVLTGAPNAGKSTLFNALVGEERAIVDDEPGTTRDVVTASVERGGVVYVLHDTAGLRDAAGRVEGKGMDRARRRARDADVVLHLRERGADAPVPDTAAVVVRVGTKADRGHAPTGCDVVTSSRDGRGLDELWARLDAEVRRRRLDEAAHLGVVLNERHQARLVQARADLAELQTLMADGAGPEVVGTMLAAVLARLGEVSGRVFHEQLLESIFARFCVGK